MISRETGAVLEMESLSPGEVGGVFGGLVALIIAIGGGLRWMLGWTDRRQELREAKLLRWEESLQRREKDYREHTEERLHDVERKCDAMAGALFEALAELQRLDPASPAIVKARMALHELYPVDMDVPDFIQNLVRRLDKGREG